MSSTPRHAPIGRYAPSPTGDLHLGNLRTALLAHDDIRSRGGTFILRIEDTDTPRNVPGSEARIIEDLAWLGITWDEGPDVGGPAGPYRQSERREIYMSALHQLIDRGLIYLCRCSRKDLQSAASAPHGSEGPVYTGVCRSTIGEHAAITKAAQDLLHSPGRDHGYALRLRTDQMDQVEFTDELHGFRRFNPADAGDFVVLRRDGLWAYQFVCAVDDALMGVTRVVRGEDLLSSTPRQVAIIKTLGFIPPVYRHVPLVADATGTRLSKRLRANGLATLKQQGLTGDKAREFILSAQICQPLSLDKF